MLIEQLEKLAGFGIQIVPAADMTSHFILERDGFVVLVERKSEGFGNIGAPGLLTDHGFAALVWRGEQAYFVARGFEQAASPEQVDRARQFGHDVQAALQS